MEYSVFRTKWMDTDICPVCGGNLIHKGKGDKPSDYVCQSQQCKFNKRYEFSEDDIELIAVLQRYVGQK